MVIVIARWRPQAGRRDELVALLREVQAASRADDGCLNYGYYSDVADPDSFIAVEEWRDEEALRVHLHTRSPPTRSRAPGRCRSIEPARRPPPPP